MADYRAVVRHVRYWRGNIHRWSTSYSFTGSGTTPDSAACSILLTADAKLCYAHVNADGGPYEAQIYHAAGGTPVATFVAFDYTVPGSWVGGTGFTAYGTSTALTEPVAETALLVRWPGGLSSSGKPVFFRKWYHSVPDTSVGAGGVPDLTTTQQTALQTAAMGVAACLAPTYGLVMGNSGRLAGSPPVAERFYSNHQMPKGRRRKPASVTTSVSFPAGLLVVPGSDGTLTTT